ncbi:hypothetical protein AALP_AA4G231100 [Arabis alpina]|uniref:TF-B3 domain-containing protein n=1 Tax=Arabis alpina TaxID=50452 RepID=A0A087H530_ARAAL|nr:hypothetical protein AALP_AA4G231100 [Arabis alpina]
MAKNRAFGSIQQDKDKASFFKILAYEDLWSESMRFIPHKFKTSVCKNHPLKVILKVVWGRSWTVSLSSFKGSYLMEKKGWEKFLNDNKLGDKEFLTFTNEGNNCLSVSIFKKNCKEMLTPRKTTIISSSSSFSNVKKEEMSDVSPIIAEGSRRGRKEKKERADEEEARKKSKKMKKKADNNNVYEASSSLVPTFSFTIKPSKLIVAAIPQDFANDHMPNETTKFIIHDPNGKPWDVVYYYTEGQKLFSSGWRILARKYGLAVGDFCTFRLIKRREMVLEVIHASQM